MKCAVIIVYDGMLPPTQAQKASATALAEYGCIHDLDHLKVYTLDEAAIVAALMHQTMPEQKFKEEPFDELKSVEVVFEIGKDSLAKQSIVSFQQKLYDALYNAIQTNTNPEIIRAVEILSSDGAEGRIPAKVRKQYYMDSRVFEAIKFVHSLCRGRHIVFR